MSNTVIDLIRHGEPVGGSRYRGHSIDDPLTEKGWQQMWDAVGDASPWDRIITSPMRRCHEFASMLAERNQVDHMVVENLKEIGFGAWEGKTKEELRQQRLDEFNRFYEDPVANTPEAAEPVTAFHARVGMVFDQLVETYTGKHLLLVVHAGVIRAAITHALDAPVDCMYRLTITNGGISRLRFNGKLATLEQLNGKL